MLIQNGSVVGEKGDANGQTDGHDEFIMRFYYHLCKYVKEHKKMNGGH